MIIDKIYYSESVEAMNSSGNKKWFKSSIEIADVNDQEQKATSIAKEYVSNTIKKSIEDNPSYLVDPATHTKEIHFTKATDIGKKEQPITTEQRLITDINTCTELKVLKSYELLAKKYPKVKEAYELKLNFLTTQLENQLTHGL
jgi:hypothetical protein